jgi:hypothetical protein
LEAIQAGGKSTQLFRKQLTLALLCRYLPLETADLFRGKFLCCLELLDRLLEIGDSISSRFISDFGSQRRFSIGVNSR